jgi:hypothetical protein
VQPFKTQGFSCSFKLILIVIYSHARSVSRSSLSFSRLLVYAGPRAIQRHQDLWNSPSLCKSAFDNLVRDKDLLL